MTDAVSQAEACAEMLKAMRQRTLSAAEISEELGLHVRTVRKWCYALEQHGILEMGVRPAAGIGAPASVFRVSSAWGGRADAAPQR